MSEINKDYHNWPGLDLYTKEFKEWIWKLFRKVHARIGHVEEELAKVKRDANAEYNLETTPIDSSTVKATLVETMSGEEHGSIIINTEGTAIMPTWDDEWER